MTDSGDGPFELRSRTLGALPVVQHFLDCLQLDELLARHVPSPNSRIQIPHAVALGVLLRNIIVGRYMNEQMSSTWWWAIGSVP